MSFNINIVSSAINVECTVESYDPEGENSLLLIRAFQFTRTLVDCLAFTSGQGFRIIFDEIVEPSGQRKHFRFANDTLALLSKTFSHNEHSAPRNLASMFKLVASDLSLALTLSDLVAATSTPGNIGVGCARAIEGLRSILLESDEDRSVSWDVFRHVLNLERAYIDYIINSSIGERHGNKYESGFDNSIILERSWTIMDRFIAFRKQNNMPLSETAYPLLL